jgi:nitrite reductase/ring-hydroxylating ferredoxin subunit
MTTEERRARIELLEEGERRLVSLDGQLVGVFRVNNELRAWYNDCPHQGGPVCSGRLTGTLTVKGANPRPQLEWVREGTILACPWHGLEFDVLDGECLAFPGVRLKPAEVEFDEDGITLKSPAWSSWDI